MLDKLKKYGQQHLLDYLEIVNNKEEFIEEINSIDFELISDLYSNIDKKVDDKDITPISYIDKNDISDLDYYKNIGISNLSKYAVVTMAGGQGTRLGHNGPKGTFMVKDKSIFEILIANLKEAKNMYGIEIPWYIMTSYENNEKTVSFFEQNNYFNYNSIKFFVQDEIEMISLSGKVLVSEDKHIKRAANGNGGVYQALKNSNIIDEFKSKGIEWVLITGVDNILVNLVDTFMLGITIDKKYLCSAKSTKKISPDEKVGVFCRKNNKPSIVEYTELTDDMRYGNEYNDANLVCNLFNLKALEMFTDKSLTYHIACKDATYLDVKGDIVSSKAYKFESFAFDFFEMLDDLLVLRVNRNDEFAPIKNKDGVDSPKTAIALYEKIK